MPGVVLKLPGFPAFSATFPMRPRPQCTPAKLRLCTAWWPDLCVVAETVFLLLEIGVNLKYI